MPFVPSEPPWGLAHRGQGTACLTVVQGRIDRQACLRYDTALHNRMGSLLETPAGHVMGIPLPRMANVSAVRVGDGVVVSVRLSLDEAARLRGVIIPSKWSELEDLRAALSAVLGLDSIPHGEQYFRGVTKIVGGTATAKLHRLEDRPGDEVGIRSSSHQSGCYARYPGSRS